jgi:hypothetical protein
MPEPDLHHQLSLACALLAAFIVVLAAHIPA